MWGIVNTTPFAVERNWIRDNEGHHHWVVAIKATFAVGHSGALEITEEQPPPCLAPVPHTEVLTSLRCDTDLGPPKQATDVLVNGSAHAPNGQPVTEMPVAIVVNGQTKLLSVRGDAVYCRGVGGITTTKPAPFTEMPVVYERAFGGVDDSDANEANHRMDAYNPVGVGFATREAHRLNKRAPNIWPHRPARGNHAPAGFGAIASQWEPRASLAGTYDAHWVETQKPLLPKDFDPRWAQCAPLDQQFPGFLPPGSRVEVANMSVEGPIGFHVPAHDFSITTFFGRTAERHHACLATVIVDSNDRAVSLCWQSSLRVASNKVEHLDGTRVELR